MQTMHAHTRTHKFAGPLARRRVGSSVSIGVGISVTYSHDYKGPAGGHLTSNFVGSIGVKRPLKSPKTNCFVMVSPLVAADTDQPFCTCVMCSERLGCTSVMRERFCMFTKCVISMLVGIFAFQAGVFAAQA